MQRFLTKDVFMMYIPRQNLEGYFSYLKMAADEELTEVEVKLATVALLCSYGLEELVKRYKVAVTRHPNFPNLVHLNAEVSSPSEGLMIITHRLQYFTPMPNSRVCRECVGLIVDEASQWNPVCVPSPQIIELSHNYQEGTAFSLLLILSFASESQHSICYSSLHVPAIEPDFNWRQFRVYEKVDGTSISLYHYAGEWHLSSRCKLGLPSIVSFK